MAIENEIYVATNIDNRHDNIRETFAIALSIESKVKKK